MLRKVLIGVGVVVVLFVVVVLTRPSHFRFARSTVIAAPAEVPFARVNDFRKWTDWSPYEKLDPNMQRSYEGPAQGVSSAYAWKGNDKAGEGRMTIERSEAPSLIVIRLDFKKPMETTNDTRFTFEPTPEGTKVTWSMEGENGFFGKAASLFFDLDAMLGKDFESGLASLKTVSETEAKSKADAR